MPHRLRKHQKLSKWNRRPSKRRLTQGELAGIALEKMLIYKDHPWDMPPHPHDRFYPTIREKNPYYKKEE